jgi:exonuclease SbcC
MARVLCIADTHIGGGPRREECERVLGLTVEQADELRPDLVAIAGDVYDGPASPADTELASEWLQRMANTAPVVVVRGNHDKALTVAHCRRLSAKHSIYCSEHAETVPIAGMAVSCLSWPSKGDLLSALGPVSQEQAKAASQQGLREVLMGLGAGLEALSGMGARARLLIAHCMVDGSVTSHGQPLVGLEFALGLEDLGLVRADAYVLGHVHCRQRFDVGGAPAFYPGSPYRRTFGEDERKGIALVELEPGNPARLEWIDLDTEQLITLDGAWSEGGQLFGDALADESLPFVAAFRLRYTVPAERAAEAAAQAARTREALLAHGATSVKVEPEILVANHARIPEVASRTTIADQLVPYWDADPTTYPEEVRPRLLGCLAELEAGATRTPSGALRLEKITARGLGALREAEIDLAQLPPASRLVAVAGPNGSGKSTLLELWTGGACFRECASRGSLVELAEWAGSRDALLEARVVNGARYTITHVVDGVARDGSSVVTNGDGSTVAATKDGKVSSFDRWSAAELPPPAVLYSGPVALQCGEDGKPTDLLHPQLSKGARKGIVLRALGVEQLEGMAETARRRAQEAGDAAKVQEAKLEVERERGGDVAKAAADLEAARESLRAAEEPLSGLLEQLAAAREELEGARRLADAWNAKAAERDRTAQELEAARQKTKDLDSKLLATRTQAKVARGIIADTEAKLPALEAEIERCRQWVAKAEEDEREHDAKQSESEDLWAKLDGMAEKVRDLHTRATELEGVLADADTIRKAEAERTAYAAQVQDFERRCLERSAEQREVLARAFAAGDAARESGKLIEETKRRISSLEEELLELPEVEKAIEGLPGFKVLLDNQQKVVDREQEELERLRGQRVAGAEDRIEGLREGLETIAVTADGDCSRHDIIGVAREALSADDDAVKLAAELPERIIRQAGQVAAAQGGIFPLRTALEAATRFADKAPRLAVAKAELEAAKVALDSQRTAEENHRAQASQLGQESKRLAEEVEWLARQRAAAEEAVRKLAGLADKAPALATAEALLEQIRPQLAAARAEWQELRTAHDELEGWLADHGAPDTEEPVEALRNATGRQADELRMLAKAREELAAATAREAELGPQSEWACSDLVAVREASEAIDRWLEQHPQPILDAYAEGLQGVELKLRDTRARVTEATSAVAVAEARHATALEAQGRVQALKEEAAATRQRQADWALLGRCLGRDGLQAALIDAAGPQLTEMANDLLHACVGPRFSVSFETTRQDAKGKRSLEDFDVRVFDAEAGRWKLAKRLSGGELALVSLAVSLALTELSCHRQGVRGCTLVRDESGSALDAERAPQFVAMLRRAADAIGADRVLLVSHVPAVIDLCDARIEMGDGTARLEA